MKYCYIDILYNIQGQSSRTLMDSPKSMVDETSEREAIETLLSICKAPSPASSENSMDSTTSNDPWNLPGDPPPQPLYGPYSSPTRNSNIGAPIFDPVSSSAYTTVPEFSGLEKLRAAPNRRESKLAQVK